MAFLRNAVKLACTDLANQYAVPVKSLVGSMISRNSSKRTEFLTKACVDQLDVGKDSLILELGYGRGRGLKMCADKIGEGGRGMVFGIERSQYMEDFTRKKYILEINEDEKIRLDRSTDLRNLPYPTDFFDGIFHVDMFYFLHDELMSDICREFNRVLKPDAKIISAMQFERLRKLEKYGILENSQWDPFRYLSRLESAGFLDVKLEYIEEKQTQPFQLLTARKPGKEEADSDPEEQMKILEKQIKKDLLMASMLEKGYKPTQEDMQLLKDL